MQKFKQSSPLWQNNKADTESAMLNIRSQSYHNCGISKNVFTVNEKDKKSLGYLPKNFVRPYKYCRHFFEMTIRW